MATVTSVQPSFCHASSSYSTDSALFAGSSFPVAYPINLQKPAMQTLQSASTSNAEVINSRSRRDRPCDSCRRRKSRCVIQEGSFVCMSCDMHRQDCTFVQNPQPRKRRTQSDGVEGARLKRRSPDQEIQETASPPNSITNASIPGQRQTESALPMATEGQHFQWTRHVQHIGTTTESEPRLFDLCLFDHNNESVTPQGAVRKVGDGDTFLKLSDEESVREGEQFHARAVGTLVGSYGARLVEIYFERVHPGFPILHKQRVLGDLADPRQRIPPPLFAAICLLALRWWHQVPGLANEQKPNPGDLEQAALNSLESAMAKPRFSTIQAGLLLQQRAGGESWPLTSQLVALGQELGLHLDCSQWQIPSWERGVRKRLAWALFMQDKWGSLIHGRPSHIFRANWAVGEVTDEDFDEDDTLEEGLEAQKMRLLFTQTIALTGLLSDVLDAFYTLQAAREAETAGENGTQLILDRAKPIQIKLKDWFKRLPPCLRMDHTDSGNLSSTGYLHLAYYATEITLHRCIVRSLRPLETDPYLLHICRSAAKTRLISAMDFVNRLKPEHLRSFWYFASRVNFALIGTFGSLLWATAPSKEEADFYRLRLGEYRWTLTVSSRSAKFIAFAVDALDSSTLLLQNLQEKPSISSGIKREPQDLEHDRTMVDVASVMHSSDFEPSGNGGGSSGDPSSTASGLASPSTSSSTGSGSRDAQTAPSEPFELIKTEDASFDFLPDRR